MSRIVTSNLKTICPCPFCTDGRGTINLVPAALEAARLTTRSSLPFTSPEFRQHPIVVFGRDGSAVEPCDHLLVIHGCCLCFHEDSDGKSHISWSALTDWRTRFFRELDPEDVTGDLEDEVFDRKCDVGLQPRVPYQAEWFDDIRWRADSRPGSSAGSWQCDGRVVFAADPRLFVTQLLELSELHYQCRALIDDWHSKARKPIVAAS